MSLGIQGASNLGDLNFHFWRKSYRAYQECKYDYEDEEFGFGYDSASGTTGGMILFVSSNGSVKIEYGDAIEIDSSGNVSISSPTRITLTKSNITNTYFASKYFRFITSASVTNAAFKSGDVFFGATNVETRTYSSYNFLNGSGRVYRVKAKVREGDKIELVSSTSDTAFPNPNGELNGYYYTYLGVPIDNAEEPSRVIQGQYVGTGTCGKNAPNSITFDRPVKWFFLFGSQSTVKGNFGVSTTGFYTNLPLLIENLKQTFTKGTAPSCGEGSSNAYCKISADGKTLTWYAGTASNQKNLSDTTYYWYAFY